ncbi:hypothetical protein [Peribacillus deserti]|uniref:NAD(P)-dependent oxidoreductase n=1 Tax=Peribacillus deserti TaxID=673318 RepID=A0A2N5M7Q0_9BACI|nr:hypothetical protein [Peribacillus deserti]PLT30390.1 hypothetical protein CUU66_07925 [Peribacillus deserti]
MQKHIIVGNFQFVGFHLCKKLLEQGNEVIGIDLRNEGNPSFEDKYLEIGRNANFSFLTLEEWDAAWNEDEDVVVYISYYDMYKTAASRSEHTIALLNSINKKSEGTAKDTILLGPIERKEEMDILQLQNESCKTILLPTVYGAWQPEDMAFQAGIQGNAANLNDIIRNEYCRDAIYIDDLLEELPSILTLELKEIILASSGEDQWAQCAKEVLTAEQLEFSQKQGTEHNLEVEVENSHKVPLKTSPEAGIAKQTEHYRKTQQLLGWK